MGRDTIVNAGKSISFVIDQPEWAFDRNIQELRLALSVLGIQSSFCYQREIPMDFVEDAVYVCWWPDTEQIRERLKPGQRLLCRIADMATWNGSAPKNWQDRFLRIVPDVYAFIPSSHEICRTLRSIGIRNSFVVGDSVNAAKFSGKVFEDGERPVLGWCGNPQALSWLGFEDLKGLHILTSLRDRNDLEFVTATGLPSREMPDWYRSIDVYVCASRIEGTPMPVLEAMATGNVIISTNVGIVSEIKSPGVFVFDGTIERLHTIVTSVLERREEWGELGKANRLYVIEHRTPHLAAEGLLPILCEG